MRNFYIIFFLSVIIGTPLFGQNIYTPKGTLVPTASYFQYTQTQA